MSKPRITAVLTKDEGGESAEVFLYLNPEGRDLLVQELLKLDEQWDHLHMQQGEWTDLPLQNKAYVPEKEVVIQHWKILYRPDSWDEQYYPHVMKDD